MDRFDAMQAFARVVETRSFTQAAATLHMSRASVTQLVQQLEARLRVRLLHRTTRQVHVTADGAAYYERVQRLLADLEDAETSLSTTTAQPRGRLRVDVPSPFARMILVPALPDFHARYPEVQLHLGVSDRMVDLIGDHVDCVVRGGEPADASLVARRVGELGLRVCAAPAYLALAGRPAHPRELQGTHHRVVGYLSSRTGKVMAYTMQRGPEQLVVEGRHALAVDDGNAYLAAGLAGLGILWLPDYMAEPHLASGELQPLFEDWRLAPMPMVVAYPPHRHLSARLRVFIDWVAELMRARPEGGGRATTAAAAAAAADAATATATAAATTRVAPRDAAKPTVSSAPHGRKRDGARRAM